MARRARWRARTGPAPASERSRAGSRGRSRSPRAASGGAMTATTGAQPISPRSRASRIPPSARNVAPMAWAKRGGYSCSSSCGGPRRRARRTGGHARPSSQYRVPNAALIPRAMPMSGTAHARSRTSAAVRRTADRPALNRWPRGSMRRPTAETVMGWASLCERARGRVGVRRRAGGVGQAVSRPIHAHGAPSSRTMSSTRVGAVARKERTFGAELIWSRA